MDEVQRYQEALLRLDEHERVTAAKEQGLRRLVARMASFGLGRHTAADPVLLRISAAMRGEVSVDAIEVMLSDMVDAVAHLDDGPVVAVRTPAAPVGHLALAEALNGIELAAELAEPARALKASLEEAVVDALLKAQELAELVNRQSSLFKDDIAALENVLHIVGARLEEIRRHLQLEADERANSADDGNQLDSLMRAQMHALGEHTRYAIDLAQLRTQVTQRLETIDQHLRTHRIREQERYAAYRDRAEQMRRRVEELETQANSLRDSLEREHERAATDPLTGIPNRLAYESHIDAAWRQWLVGRRPLCVAALDIDHFKRINDTLGHAAGDAVLRVVGQALHAQSDDRLFVCRYGGEEFVLVFTDTSLDEAMLRGEKLRALVEALSFRAGGRPVPVTLSGGFASFEPGDMPEQTLARADRALYAAKDAGRNRLAV